MWKNKRSKRKPSVAIMKLFVVFYYPITVLFFCFGRFFYYSFRPASDPYEAIETASISY